MVTAGSDPLGDAQSDSVAELVTCNPASLRCRIQVSGLVQEEVCVNAQLLTSTPSAGMRTSCARIVR